jgi:hypothetical protein
LIIVVDCFSSSWVYYTFQIPLDGSLFSGNIQSNEAESMVQQIEDVFYKGSQPLSQALFASQHLTNRVVKLDRGVNHFYRAEGLNPNDENSALLHYIQVHVSNFCCEYLSVEPRSQFNF